MNREQRQEAFGYNTGHGGVNCVIIWEVKLNSFSRSIIYSLLILVSARKYSE